jgi:SAM-dependent methyltransferase
MQLSVSRDFADASWPGRPALPADDIFGNVKKMRFILRVLDDYRARVNRDIAVLDFGCGNAIGVGQYLVGKGIRYVGVDFHGPSLTYARQHFGGDQAEFLETVPQDRMFDVIIYADVLEHVPDPLAIVSAHARLLAPGGIIIGTVPNGYGPCEIEKFVDRHLRLYKMLRFVKRTALGLAGRSVNPAQSVPYNSECGHVIFFTLGSLRRMAADAGFEIIRFAHGGFVGADLTGNTIFAGQRFADWNGRTADRLPSWMVSTWYFVLRRPEPR